MSSASCLSSRISARFPAMPRVNGTGGPVRHSLIESQKRVDAKNDRRPVSSLPGSETRTPQHPTQVDDHLLVDVLPTRHAVERRSRSSGSGPSRTDDHGGNARVARCRTPRDDTPCAKGTPVAATVLSFGPACRDVTRRGRLRRRGVVTDCCMSEPAGVVSCPGPLPNPTGGHHEHRHPAS